jgi:tRNA dimethylallyltransferase
VNEIRPEEPSAQPIVVILGPTATGKSAVAIKVALRLNGEVISADSRAFFRGLDIATDKPPRSARCGVVHHLFDVVGINGNYDAMAFRQDADRVIRKIRKRKHVPILVGGGTLYLGALLRGLFPGPSADTALRKELAERPLSELYEKLCTVDPKGAAKIHLHDRLRIVRALEVYELTGQPISTLQQDAQPLPHRFVRFGLRRAKSDHRAAIAARVDRMLERGLVDEVTRLRHEGLNQNHQAYRTIGVREVFDHLDGKITSTQLRDALITNTWALVRRQMAWFRNEKDVLWIDVTNRVPEAVAEEIVTQLPEGLRQG